MKDNLMTRHNAINQTTTFAELLAIKFKLHDIFGHVKLNDYKLGHHLSVTLSQGVQTNIMIDSEREYIYVSAVLSYEPYSLDLGSLFDKIRTKFIYVERTTTTLQLFRPIAFFGRMDATKIASELRTMDSLSRYLVNEFPGALSAGSVNEENFYLLGDLTSVRHLQNMYSF